MPGYIPVGMFRRQASLKIIPDHLLQIAEQTMCDLSRLARDLSDDT